MNINKIYDTIEAKVTELTGSRPNATECLSTDLGCDSLDLLDVVMAVEKEHNVTISAEVIDEIPSEATVLDLAIFLTAIIDEIQPEGMA